MNTELACNLLGCSRHSLRHLGNIEESKKAIWVHGDDLMTSLELFPNKFKCKVHEKGISEHGRRFELNLELNFFFELMLTDEEYQIIEL
jgi:hypothetical protein